MLVKPALGFEPETLKACQVFQNVQYHKLNLKGDICLYFKFKHHWFENRDVSESSDRTRTCDHQILSGISKYSVPEI